MRGQLVRRAAASRSLPRSLAPRLPAAAHATPPSPWAGTMLHGPGRVHEREEEKQGRNRGWRGQAASASKRAAAASRSSASLDVSAATDRLASEHPQAQRNIAAQALGAAAVPWARGAGGAASPHLGLYLTETGSIQGQLSPLAEYFQQRVRGLYNLCRTNIVATPSSPMPPHPVAAGPTVLQLAQPAR